MLRAEHRTTKREANVCEVDDWLRVRKFLQLGIVRKRKGPSFGGRRSPSHPPPFCSLAKSVSDVLSYTAL